MTFAQAERAVLALVDENRSRGRLGLDRMRALLRELGDPQNRYSTVHVGGTSGKGSTATMIAAALEAAGNRTGLHTKPHLHSMTERACIDGRPVSPERFASLFEEMLPAMERTAAVAGSPSYYETLLGLAFVYFAQERVDWAVVEVGLGGRLDGTNVLVPRVAVITTVDFDHTDVLGETIESIAAEKAGIAKPGVPLVVGAERPQAIAVIERAASKVGAPLRYVSRESTIVREVGDGRAFEVRTARGTYRLRLGVWGAFQRQNARCAIVALEALPPPLRPGIEQIERGLNRTEIPARMEIIAGDPTIVLDIAHNSEKATRLAESLAERWPNRTFRALVAVAQGKNASAIVEALAPIVERFTFTSFSADGRRAVEPAELVAVARSIGRAAEAVADPRLALEHARAAMGVGDVLVVTGSTFVVANLRKEIVNCVSIGENAPTSPAS